MAFFRLSSFFLMFLIHLWIFPQLSHAAQSSTAIVASAPRVKFAGLEWCKRLLKSAFPNKKVKIVDSGFEEKASKFGVVHLTGKGYERLFKQRSSESGQRGAASGVREYIGRIELSVGAKSFIPVMTKPGPALFFRVSSADEAGRIFKELDLKQKVGYALHRNVDLSWSQGALFDLRSSLPASEGDVVMEVGVGYLPNGRAATAGLLFGALELGDAGKTPGEREQMIRLLTLLNSFHEIGFFRYSGTDEKERHQKTRQEELKPSVRAVTDITMLTTPFYGWREELRKQGVFHDLDWRRHNERERTGWVGRRRWVNYGLELVFLDSGEVAVALNAAEDFNYAFPQELVEELLNIGMKAGQKDAAGAFRFRDWFGEVPVKAMTTDFIELTPERSKVLRIFMEDLVHLLEFESELDDDQDGSNRVISDFPLERFPALADPALSSVGWLPTKGRSSLGQRSFVVRGRWSDGLAAGRGYELLLHDNGMMDLQLWFPNAKAGENNVRRLRDQIHRAATQFFGSSDVLIEEWEASVTVKDIHAMDLRATRFLSQLSKVLHMFPDKG